LGRVDYWANYSCNRYVPARKCAKSCKRVIEIIKIDKCSQQIRYGLFYVLALNIDM
jgi:hypothetical protein